MGQNNCTPTLPGLENCLTKQQYIDENNQPKLVITNKQPITLYTSMAESHASFSNPKHYELYQKQQDLLKSYLQNSRVQELTNSVKRNVEFSNRLLKLPSHIICHILYFVIDNYLNLLLINSLWYTRFNGAVTKTLSHIENTFQSAFPFLKLKRTSLSFKRFRIDQYNTGFRLDKHLVAEVLSGYENHLVKFGLSFKQKGIPKTVWYKFAIYRQKAKKMIWVGVDQSANIYDKNVVPVIQPVLPFCVGDYVKIPLTILNLNGLMDIQQMKWLPAQFEKFEVGIFDNPKHDFMQPPARLEPQDADWQLYEYFENPMKRCFDNLTQLKLKDCRCFGNSLIINKMTYICQKEGIVQKAEQLLNLKVTVKSHHVENEVKRAALTRPNPIQFYNFSFGLWNSIGVLIGFIFLYRFLAYFGLLLAREKIQ